MRFVGSTPIRLHIFVRYSTLVAWEGRWRMHLLYVDDSGSAGNPEENFFVLAGVAIYETRLYHLITALDRVVSEFGLELEEAHQIELHGSAMHSGRKEFYPIKRPMLRSA